MNSNKASHSHVAFLRGINVGGNHKVSMSAIQKEFKILGFKNIVTLLNSGNILFDTISDNNVILENLIQIHLKKSFGFTIPTIIRNSETIIELSMKKPFEDIKFNKDIRLYVSFLREDLNSEKKSTWDTTDDSFKIINFEANTICSVLDLSISKTSKAMKTIEQDFGKDITTRNWNTIKRIVKKLIDN